MNVMDLLRQAGRAVLGRSGAELADIARANRGLMALPVTAGLATAGGVVYAARPESPPGYDSVVESGFSGEEAAEKSRSQAGVQGEGQQSPEEAAESAATRTQSLEAQGEALLNENDMNAAIRAQVASNSKG